MNTLQNELNTINEKLEILHYRKLQLEAIITEYNDVINRTKKLIDLMQDNDVAPENLLYEIEGLIDPGPNFKPEEPEPAATKPKSETEAIATEQEPTPEHPILWGIAQAQAEKQGTENLNLDQLNERAWRDGDWLLIGFTSDSTRKAWRRHYESQPDIETYPETLDEYPYGLRVIHHGHTGSFWDVAGIDFSKHPNKQPLKPSPDTQHPTPEPKPEYEFLPQGQKHYSVMLGEDWLGTVRQLDNGIWIIDGGTEPFNSREEAAKRLRELWEQQQGTVLGCKNPESLTA